MSISASAATATAVSASISTPVRSAVRTVAVIATPSSSTTRSTVDPVDRDRVAQRDEVGGALGGLDSGDPRDRERIPLRHLAAQQRHDARRDSITRPVAVAVRTVTSLPETSTMRAAPVVVEVGEAAHRLRPRLAVKHHHLHGRPGRAARDVLGHHDQGVGRGQRGELVASPVRRPAATYTVAVSTPRRY